MNTFAFKARIYGVDVLCIYTGMEKCVFGLSADYSILGAVQDSLTILKIRQIICP